MFVLNLSFTNLLQKGDESLENNKKEMLIIYTEKGFLHFSQKECVGKMVKDGHIRVCAAPHHIPMSILRVFGY
jgi:hypothetical protein